MANFSYLNESLNKFKQLNKLIESGLGVTKNFAEDVEEGSDESKVLIQNLKDIMIEYAAMERDIKNTFEAVEYAKTKFQDSVSNDREQPDMECLYTDKLREFTSNNKPDDLMKHKAVKGFIDTVWKQHLQDHVGEQSVYEGDEDIQMTQSEDKQRFICPITKIEFVDPVKNRACNHTYSRHAIEQHIKNNQKQRARCPVAGCIHFVTPHDLQEDAVVAFEMRKAKR